MKKLIDLNAVIELHQEQEEVLEFQKIYRDLMTNKRPLTTEEVLAQIDAYRNAYKKAIN